MQKQQFLCQLVYQHYFASRSPHKKRRTRQDPERMVVGVPVVVMIIIYPDPDRERHLLLYNILELAIFITYIYIHMYRVCVTMQHRSCCHAHGPKMDSGTARPSLVGLSWPENTEAFHSGRVWKKLTYTCK